MSIVGAALVAGAAVGCSGTRPGPATGQEANASVGTARPAALTGCLTQGPQPGIFLLNLTDGSEADHSGYRVLPEAGLDVGASVGQKVTVVGLIGAPTGLDATSADVQAEGTSGRDTAGADHPTADARNPSAPPERSDTRARAEDRPVMELPTVRASSIKPLGSTCTP